MAKKIKDPQFNLGYALPEGVVNDFDIFYKPQTAPKNREVASLINSLSNIVPTLATYDVIEQAELKGKNEAQAVEDFNVNKEAFATLVKSKKMPAGANPHYFNKMMELDLATKARDFQRKFDDYYVNNMSDMTDQDTFKSVYQDELKTFYKENNLDKYDPIALNKAFFSTTSKYRDDKEFTHNNNRLAKIEKQTKELEVRDYAGSFIDFQYKDASIDDVHAFIKSKTNDYISLTKNKNEANELFLTGLKTYVGAVNTTEGFEYARKLVASLDNLNLGTGSFSGSNRALYYQKTMENELAEKELSNLQREDKLFTVRKERDEQQLTNDYFNFRENPEFEFGDLIGTLDGDGEFSNDKYNARQKNYLTELHNATEEGRRVKNSSPSALVELIDLQENNPYLIRQSALQLMEAGELTIADFERFNNSAGNYDVLENNVFFRKSRVFNNLRNFFDDPRLAQFPDLKVEVPLLKMDFENDVVQYWNSIKDENITPQEKQIKLNGEIKLLIGRALQESRIFGQNEDLLTDLSTRYKIYIPNIGEQ